MPPHPQGLGGNRGLHSDVAEGACPLAMFSSWGSVCEVGWGGGGGVVLWVRGQFFVPLLTIAEFSLCTIHSPASANRLHMQSSLEGALHKSEFVTLV